MKPTPAQLALLHIGESAASSAVFTLLTAILQQTSTGQISPTVLLTVFGSGFAASFGLIYKSVKSAPQLKQAETDTAAQITQYVEQRFGLLEARIASMFSRSQASAQPTSPQMSAAPQIPTFNSASVTGSFSGPMPQQSGLPATGQYWPPSAMPPSSRPGIGG